MIIIEKVKIPKRISTAILNSLRAGVVPRIGLEYINVGRKHEIETILDELDNVAEGGSFLKFIVGKYGSGKSFMLQLIRNYAMDRGYIVADVDLSPERRLSGTKGQGLATYRELMHNLSTKIRPDGGALPSVLERWISGIQANIIKSEDIGSGAGFDKEIEKEIINVINGMENAVHGFDFANIILTYWNGYKGENDILKNAALKWLRGEFSTKTEAKNELSVRTIIDDDTWFDYLKLITMFIRQIGYKGLIIFIDEAVNLYKITHTESRLSNYEKLLSMFNDTMQGKVSHMGILIGGTPQFVFDTRRGLYSYEALRSRLTTGKIIDGYNDLKSPVIQLETLSDEEIFLLLNKLKNIHSVHYGYNSDITDENIESFMQLSLDKLGAEEQITPRELIRDFISILNVMQQNPGLPFDKIVKDVGVKNADPSKKDDFSEFYL